MNRLKADVAYSCLLVVLLLFISGMGFSENMTTDLGDFEKKFKSEDPIERVNAVIKLAKMDSISAIPILERATKDADSQVRAAAITAIKEVCINVFLKNVSHMLGDYDTDVKDDIIKALADINYFKTNDFLEKLARDADPSIRVRAIAVMGKTRATAFLPTILEALNDDDEQTRVTAIYALLEFQLKSHAKSIAGLIFDEDYDVQEAAINVLGNLKNEEVLPALSKLSNDEDEKIRENVVKCIGRIKSKEGVPILVQMLSDPSKMVKISAINALSKIEIKDASTIPRIGKFITDEDKDIRRNAIHSLKAFDSIDAIPFLLKGTKDQEALNRSASLIFISKILKDETISEEISSAINEAAKDPDKGVRQSAALAIANMNDHTHFEILISLLKDQDSNVRHTAIMVLGDLKEKKAVPHLISAFEDKDAMIRLAIIKALQKIGDSSALPIFKEAAKNDELIVRKIALSALGDFNDPESEAILKKALHDPIDEIRLEAKNALRKLGMAKKEEK